MHFLLSVYRMSISTCRNTSLIVQIWYLSVTFGPIKNCSDFVVDNLKNVIGFKILMDQWIILMDQVLILRDLIWTIKLDFRKDQRIFISKYLMTFKPFSSFCTDKLVEILAIFNYPLFVCTNS